jgi:hypothetical protein
MDTRLVKTVASSLHPNSNRGTARAGGNIEKALFDWPPNAESHNQRKKILESRFLVTI